VTITCHSAVCLRRLLSLLRSVVHFIVDFTIDLDSLLADKRK
jgi:hypothetical protein